MTAVIYLFILYLYYTIVFFLCQVFFVFFVFFYTCTVFTCTFACGSALISLCELLCFCRVIICRVARVFPCLSERPLLYAFFCFSALVYLTCPLRSSFYVLYGFTQLYALRFTLHAPCLFFAFCSLHNQSTFIAHP